MTDLPKALRLRLVEAGLGPLLKVVEDHLSADSTRKLLVEMADGKRVETVLIPRGAVPERDVYSVQDDSEGDVHSGQAQVSQCISSQVGCAMGCAFCASGIAGLKRNMTAGEIVSQVLMARRLLPEGTRHSGVVFMGMGEPLHNYDAVARTLALLNHPEGVGMSLRRMTLSTSGLAPQIDRLAEDFGGRVQLAVSIHSPDSATRTEIMPINKKHDLRVLMESLRAYPLAPTRKITVEYTLMAGINAGRADARSLIQLLDGIEVKVNLIPMNPVPDAVFQAPSSSAVDRFQQILRDGGVDSFVRRRKGDDIAAACGQLALHGEKRKIRLKTLPTA